GAPEWGRELKTLVEKVQFDDWDYEDRKRLLAFLASWHAPANMAPPKVDKPPPATAPAAPRTGKVDLSYRGETPPPAPETPPASTGGGTTKNEEVYQHTVDAGREALVEGKFDMALMLAAQLKREFPAKPGGAALAEDVAAAKAAARRDL